MATLLPLELEAAECIICLTVMHCSSSLGNEERLEELRQQEQAMTLFMSTFATNKASKLAELEAMQLTGKQIQPDRSSIPDVPHIDFDESQVRAARWQCELLQ